MKVFLNILPDIDEFFSDNVDCNESVDNINRGTLFIIISNEILAKCQENQAISNSYRLTVGLFNLGQGVELTLKGLLRICGKHNDYDHSNIKLNEELIENYLYDDSDDVKKQQLDFLNANIDLIKIIDNSRDFAYSKKKDRNYTKNGIINSIEDLSLMINSYLGRLSFLYITLINKLFPNDENVQKQVRYYCDYYNKLEKEL